MIVLDTDHLSVLKYDEHPRCRVLRERMNVSEDPFFATTIISAEEQMRGWLAKIQGFQTPTVWHRMPGPIDRRAARHTGNRALR